MKFLIDAQLPKKLSSFLISKGIDSIHTLDLPQKNLTPDNEIIRICESNNRVVVTKDSDFYESKLIKNIPKKIVFVQTGNIQNEQLIHIFDLNLDIIIKLLNDYDIVEVEKESLKAK